MSAAGVSVNGEIYHECEHEPLSVSGPTNVGCDSVVSEESPSTDVEQTARVKLRYGEELFNRGYFLVSISGRHG